LKRINVKRTVMKQSTAFFLACTLFLISTTYGGLKAQTKGKNQQSLQVDISKGALSKATPVSPFIFGQNLEHTRSSVYGGISAELLRNRKFTGKPHPVTGQALEWEVIGDGYFAFYGNESRTAFDEAYTRHVQPDKMRRVNERNNQIIRNHTTGSKVGIKQDRLSVQAKNYDFRIVLRTDRDLPVTVTLSGENGVVYDETVLNCHSRDWQTYTWSLSCLRADKKANLSITFTESATLTIGAVSLLPADHFRGMRRDVVEHLKNLGISILRWPGGNFAGEYRWLDGLLPCDQRAPLRSYMESETQPHSLGVDFHEIAIDDFIALCREIGAEPYISINLSWDTPEECAQFVEYCNGLPSSVWGRKRADRGFPEPYNVLFWSLGNEMGYGHMEGPNTPVLYKEKAMACGRAMLQTDPRLRLFYSGPFPNDEWLRDAVVPLSEIAPFVSHHSYSPMDVHLKMDFTTPESSLQTYAYILSGSETNYSHIQMLRQRLDAVALEGRPLHIAFDEWNLWYAWYRHPGVAEGIYTARMLHLFLNVSHKYDMPVCCYFEPVNEGAIRVTPEQSTLTANGQMFALLSAHRNGELLPLSGDGLTPFDAVATMHNQTITFTAINSDPVNSKDYRLILKGAKKADIQATVYASERFHNGTTFTAAPLSVEKNSQGQLSFTLPKHAVGVCIIKISQQ